MMFVTTPLSLQHIQSGKLRALAYTGSKRAPFPRTCRSWPKPALPAWRSMT